MNLELYTPCLADVTGCVNAKEVGDKKCCGDIDNPKIISPASQYHVTFSWNSSGTLFNILPPNATWKLEVYLENLGGETGSTPLGGQRGDQNLQKSATKVHAPGAQSETVIFNPTELAPMAGTIVKVVAKLHLKVGIYMIVCGFDELQTIHIAEN
jgi:hypothetical protein